MDTWIHGYTYARTCIIRVRRGTHTHTRARSNVLLRDLGTSEKETHYTHAHTHTHTHVTNRSRARVRRKSRESSRYRRGNTRRVPCFSSVHSSRRIARRFHFLKRAQIARFITSALLIKLIKNVHRILMAREEFLSYSYRHPANS